MPGKTAILIVNGFDRRGIFGPYAAEEEARLYPWIGLCLRQIHRWSEAQAHLLLYRYENSGLLEHLAILSAYDRVRVFPAKGRGKNRIRTRSTFWWKKSGRISDTFSRLDNDAFPIRAGWIGELTSALDSGAALAGVWRDEMAPVIRPLSPSQLPLYPPP